MLELEFEQNHLLRAKIIFSQGRPFSSTSSRLQRLNRAHCLTKSRLLVDLVNRPSPVLRKCDSGAQWNAPMRHIEHCPTLGVVRCLIPKIETRPTKREVSISIRPVGSGVKLHDRCRN